MEGNKSLNQLYKKIAKTFCFCFSEYQVYPQLKLTNLLRLLQRTSECIVSQDYVVMTGTHELNSYLQTELTYVGCDEISNENFRLNQTQMR